jgi:hypothetical protein
MEVAKLSPQRLMPGLESLRLRGDGGACNCELAILAVQVASVHVVVDWIDDARVYTGEQHGVVSRLLRPCADRCEVDIDPHPSQETKEAAPGNVSDSISARL